MVDWEHHRKHRLTTERPSQWPDGVYAISTNGLVLLGIHEVTNALYWDGKEIVVRRTFRLGTFERWIASLAALGTVGTFAVHAARFLGYGP